jgi:hypothetical protein
MDDHSVLPDGADKCRWLQSGQIVGYYVGNLVIGFLGPSVWCGLGQLCRIRRVGTGLGGPSLLGVVAPEAVAYGVAVALVLVAVCLGVWTELRLAVFTGTGGLCTPLCGSGAGLVAFVFARYPPCNGPEFFTAVNKILRT